MHPAELAPPRCRGVPLALRQRRLAHGALDDLPEAVGAFLGAVVLSSLSGDTAKPLGGRHPQRARRLRAVPVPRPALRLALAGCPLPSSGLLAPLGLGAGFLDAVGGGGWGPVGTPILLAWPQSPRKVIGSVDTGEFPVAPGPASAFRDFSGAGRARSW